MLNRLLQIATVLFGIGLVFMAEAQPVRQFVPGSTGPACASVADAWSTTYFNGAGGGSPYYTLSGANLTAVTAAASANHQAVEIGIRCHSSGKYYFEIVTAGMSAGDDHSWGLATASHSNIQQLGFNNTAPLDSIGYDDFSAARAWRYGGTLGANVGLAVPTSGQSLGIAINFNVGGGNSGICIHNASAAPAVWYGATNTCDPVAGTNMYTFGQFAAPVYIAMASNQNGGTGIGGTINAHGTFVAAAPSGYSSWQ